jgi:hypothetical protein
MQGHGYLQVTPHELNSHMGGTWFKSELGPDTIVNAGIVP